MKQAGIGIVIPVYNRERELRRTFDSVVAQTYRPIHVVLVDNGSTDGSLALCRELKGAYETDDFRITVVGSPEPRSCLCDGGVCGFSR
mgnify:CR=1 FL=1